MNTQPCLVYIILSVEILHARLVCFLCYFFRASGTVNIINTAVDVIECLTFTSQKKVNRENIQSHSNLFTYERHLGSHKCFMRVIKGTSSVAVFLGSVLFWCIKPLLLKYIKITWSICQKMRRECLS